LAARDEDISKQDALRATGISYGQFYRWKRMGLIPEAWFQRRATFTGQETFLPRRKLLDRIRRIQALKNHYSLEEIAQLLSPDLAHRAYSLGDVSGDLAFSARAMDLSPPTLDAARLRFSDLVYLAAVEEIVQLGDVPDDHIRLGAETLRRGLVELKDVTGERHLVLAERNGNHIAILHSGEIVFDEGTNVLASLSVDRLIEDLKVRLQEAIG
jgi:hypothetical protein